ncbi:DUF5004 domain-containing protein [Arenibacter sp. TNZ]|jgi:hypothetical protein|uniref:DUF5004 domain-containing protein n=1 Tax=Arenibacter TaxID=178469 RepID=UPI000CD3BC20|nr:MULTISPECIES: DUF5004 domain-containing protein [Arenibacter]MCM4171181.1 DUF5004 domain-containing protein [Arenibacter sp. TNZ]
MKKGFCFMLIGTIVMGSLFIGCNTDNSVECPADFEGALTEEENGLIGTWKLTAILAEKEVDITNDNEENPKKDIFIQYSECERDSDYTFGPGRAYEFSQGENATSCSNKVKLAGTWKLSAGTLGLIGNCSSQNLTIVVNPDKSAYSITSNYNITDVKGLTIQTDVKFTYTKEVVTP